MKKLVYVMLVLTVFTGMFSACAYGAPATDYPTKPITLVVPFTLGSGDTEARMFGVALEKYLGQPVVPTNIVGGSGGVAMTHTMQAEPDGYTVCFMSATMAFGMAHGNISYKPQDLNVMGSFNAETMGLFVPKDSPFKTIGELIDYAKQHPGELLVGGTNVASAHHSFFITLCNEAGVEMQYVPYGGSNDTTLSFLGGNLNAGIFSPNSMREYMSTEGVRLLIYAGKEHDQEFEGVPIGKDLGYPKIDDLLQFRSYITTPGVPEEVMQVLDAAFVKAFNDPEYQQHIKNIGAAPFYKNRKDFAEFLATFVENAAASFSQMEK